MGKNDVAKEYFKSWTEYQTGELQSLIEYTVLLSSKNKSGYPTKGPMKNDWDNDGFVDLSHVCH